MPNQEPNDSLPIYELKNEPNISLGSLIGLTRCFLTDMQPYDAQTAQLIEGYLSELQQISQKFTESKIASDYLEVRINSLIQSVATEDAYDTMQTDIAICLKWLCSYMKEGLVPRDFPDNQLSDVINTYIYRGIFIQIRQKLLAEAEKDQISIGSWNQLASYFNRFLIDQFSIDK